MKAFNEKKVDNMLIYFHLLKLWSLDIPFLRKRMKLQSVNNFPLLFKELDTLHFAAFGNQRGKFL